MFHCNLQYTGRLIFEIALPKNAKFQKVIVNLPSAVRLSFFVGVAMLDEVMSYFRLVVYIVNDS